MPIPLRLSTAQQSAYDTRPVTTNLMGASDQGFASAYPGVVQGRQGQEINDPRLAALERRLAGDTKKDADITGKKSNGAGKPDYITPRTL